MYMPWPANFSMTLLSDFLKNNNNNNIFLKSFISLLKVYFMSVLGSPGSSVSMSPAKRRNLLNHKRGSIAHSLSLSYSHRSDMTEIQ